MRFELRIRPRGLELLYEIRGTHHFFLQLADQFDCSGIDEADVRNIIFGRILHGDRFAAREQFRQCLVKLFPARVDIFAAFERIEHAGFDSVDQLSRLAFRRDKVKPAPRGEPVAAEFQNYVGDRVTAVMIVEKPAVDFGGPQLCLNCFNVYHVLGILVVPS
jgi:hypothetical protein